MAKATTTITDPDEKLALEAHDRTQTLLTSLFNEMEDRSLDQIDFCTAVVAFMRGVDPKAIASGAASLAATTPVTGASTLMLGGTGTGPSTSGGPVSYDPAALGNEIAKALSEAGYADPSVGMAFIRTILQQMATYNATAMPDQRNAYMAAMGRLATSWTKADYEADGTPKVIASLTAANAAKTAAETNLQTVTRERDDLRTKFANARAKWDAFRAKINDTDVSEGGKFKKNAPVPTAEAAELNTALS